jgi:cytochrome P450
MVVTNDRDDIKKIYGSVKVIKAPFYDKFGIINNERSCLALRDPTEAMHRRRCYLPLFARRNLLKFAPKIYEHLREFIGKLRDMDSRGAVVDSVRWWRYLTFDVVSMCPYSRPIFHNIFDLISDCSGPCIQWQV